MKSIRILQCSLVMLLVLGDRQSAFGNSFSPTAGSEQTSGARRIGTSAQWRYAVTDDGVEILSYNGNEASVSVPEELDGGKVRSIGARAFSRKNVKRMVLPDGVTAIGMNAFEGCRQLEEVNLPDSIVSIGRWAFFGCRSLKAVRLSSGLQDPRIDAFKGCDGLMEVSINNKTLLKTPPTTTTDDIRTMLGVSRRTKIVQYEDSKASGAKDEQDEDERYKRVGKYRVKKYAEPERETGMNNAEQSGGRGVKHLELILSETGLNICEDVGLPLDMAITNIAAEAGSYITLPTDIVARAEQYLMGKYRSGERSRGYEFTGWSGNVLRKGKITCNGRFKNGATFLLQEDTKLTAIWGRPPSVRIVFDIYNRRYGTGSGRSEMVAVKGVSVTLPTEEVARAREKLSQRDSDYGWRRQYDFVHWEWKGLTFKDGAMITPEQDMRLTAVWKPQVAYCVRNGILEGIEMNGYDTLTIPADVTEISEEMIFRSGEENAWSALSSVTVSPENKHCFVRDGIIYYSKDDSRKEIVAARLFKERENLVIPEDVTQIGRRAFMGCPSIMSVSFPVGVREIPKMAFKQCTGIRRLDLPESIKSVGEKTFEECTSLESVTLGAGLTNIAADAFVGCDKLTNIVFSSGIERVFLDDLPDGVHITLPLSVRSFKLDSRKAKTMEKFYLTIVTEDGRITREIYWADLEKTDWPQGWAEWDWMKRQAVFQTRCADKEKALLYPADALCNSHPSLYREFCAGADRLWCVRKLREMGNDKNKIQLGCDDKLGILRSVRVTFPSPGVSLEALLKKYKERAVGRFWVRGPRGDDERFYEGIIPKAIELFADSRTIVVGDDELMIALLLSEDHWTDKSKIQWIGIESRKLMAALAERDRRDEAEKKRAEDMAQKKLEDAALDF